MPTANPERCANANCLSVTTMGKYRSSECEQKEEAPDLDCRCGDIISKDDPH